MTELLRDPDRVISQPGDLYRIQRRPNTNQLVCNDDYRGLRVIDPWSSGEIARLPFPSGYDATGIFDAWCFSANGAEALVFNNEARVAAWLSLSRESAPHSFEYPPHFVATSLVYLWEEVLIVSDAARTFRELERHDEIPALVERRSIDIRVKYEAWRRSLERLPFECNVLRHEPDKQRLLYLDHMAEPACVGIMSWHDRAADWAIPILGPASRLAADDQRLFILNEDNIQSWNSSGQLEVTYVPPAGYQFFDLDTLPAGNAQPAILAALCASRTLTADDQLAIYVI